MGTTGSKIPQPRDGVVFQIHPAAHSAPPKCDVPSVPNLKLCPSAETEGNGTLLIRHLEIQHEVCNKRLKPKDFQKHRRQNIPVCSKSFQCVLFQKLTNFHRIYDSEDSVDLVCSFFLFPSNTGGMLTTDCKLKNLFLTIAVNAPCSGLTIPWV